LSLTTFWTPGAEEPCLPRRAIFTRW